MGHGISAAGVAHSLDAGDQIPDLAGRKRTGRLSFQPEKADLLHLVYRFVIHEPDPFARLDGTFKNSEMTIKAMGRKKLPNLYQYLLTFPKTLKSAERFKNELDFTPEQSLPQRKLVDLGQIISRVVSANQVIELGESGFRPDLIGDCLQTIQHEIKILLKSYNNHGSIQPVESYSEDGNWLDFCK